MQDERADISAKFLLASPPPSTTVVPAGFKITVYGARHARGTRKTMSSGLGGHEPVFANFSTRGGARALAAIKAR